MTKEGGVPRNDKEGDMPRNDRGGGLSLRAEGVAIPEKRNSKY